ncbi:MAG TPA: hypothetical protein VEB67_03820, partial [Nitrososphaerales archaeon]|nr:hypothetical protein [Nitrososphaerales archaeon]
MALSLADAGLLLISFALPLVLVLGAMPPFRSYLIRSGRVVDDVHKRPVTKVPTPGGPVVALGAVVGELAVFLLTGSLVPVAVGSAAAIAFAVGIYDDLKVLGGLTKPLLLVLAGVPLVLLYLVQPTLYNPVLTFPFLGDTAPHLTIYTILALAAFPIVANAFNMMDSFNGQISWFSLLVSLAVLFGVSLRTWYAGNAAPAQVASVLPLVGISLG